MRKFNIYDRSFELAVKICAFVNTLENTLTTREFIKQVIRSSASIGANLEEADGALTRRDFINKLGISRREARGTGYWLRLLRKTCPPASESLKKELDHLINESREILLILSAIINSSKQK